MIRCARFGGNLAAAKSVRNRGYVVIGCRFQFSGGRGKDARLGKSGE